MSMTATPQASGSGAASEPDDGLVRRSQREAALNPPTCVLPLVLCDEEPVSEQPIVVDPPSLQLGHFDVSGPLPVHSVTQLIPPTRVVRIVLL